MTPPAIFLDTTIQIDRLLYTSDVRSKIQQNLQNKRIYTSSTVYLEFKRTILQDIQYIRTLVKQKSGSKYIQISDIDRWLSRGEGNFSARSRDRCKLVTAAIKDVFDGQIVSQSELLVYLEMLVANLEEYFFQIDLGNGRYFDMRVEDTYINQAGCALSEINVRPGDILTTRLACRAGKTDCHLDKFLAKQSDELHLLHQTLAALPKTQRDEKAFVALDNILTNGFERALGEHHCWAMGDIIIALEAPIEAVIYTTNRNHFLPLCGALGKHLFVE